MYVMIAEVSSEESIRHLCISASPCHIL